MHVNKCECYITLQFQDGILQTCLCIAISQVCQDLILVAYKAFKFLIESLLPNKGGNMNYKNIIFS